MEQQAAEQAGRKAFQDFASGAWPFRGRKTPKNPNKRDSAEYNEWAKGYDAELGAWFRA